MHLKKNQVIQRSFEEELIQFQGFATVVVGTEKRIVRLASIDEKTELKNREKLVHQESKGQLG